MAVLMILSLVFLGFAGYAQRLLLALLTAWMVVGAFRLMQPPQEVDGPLTTNQPQPPRRRSS